LIFINQSPWVRVDVPAKTRSPANRREWLSDVEAAGAAAAASLDFGLDLHGSDSVVERFIVQENSDSSSSTTSKRSDVVVGAGAATAASLDLGLDLHRINSCQVG
jgi:hypothetical protein